MLSLSAWQVATELHHLLRDFAPNKVVEKASYDDFYLDMSSLAAEPGSVFSHPPDGLSLAGGCSWTSASPHMRAAIQVRPVFAGS